MEGTYFLQAPFGELLKHYRKGKKVTQRQLAEKLGIHYNSVWAWERGDHLPETKGMVLEIARQLRLNDQDTRHLLEASLTAVSPYWAIPYPRNRFFTGRDELLKDLHNLLCQNRAAVLTQSFALSGMGGIGKTQTAIEYAYRHTQHYSALFWIDAETSERMLESYTSIASLLSLSTQYEADQQKIVASVIRWLISHRDWLLIIDNLEERTLIQPILPALHSGSLLLTTRMQALGTIAQPLAMERMTVQEGAQLLLRRAGRILPGASLNGVSMQEVALAEAIVEAMDGLPLAIDQAGAYIEETQCSLADYWALYQSSAVTLLNEPDKHSDYPVSVVKTFTLAFEKIQQRNLEAIELLCACSFLAPDAIPEQLLIKGAPLLGSCFLALTSHPWHYQAAVKDLLAYSLMHRQGEAKILTMHRLVQAIIQESLPEMVQKAWVERIIQLVNQSFPADRLTRLTVEQWAWCGQLLAHALVGAALSERWQDAFPDVSQFLLKTANYLRDRARYREAEPLYERAMVVCTREQGSSHPLTALCRLHRGLLYEYEGKDSEAEPLYLQSLAICERELGPIHTDTIQCLNTLAALYNYQGRYKEAEPLYLRALATCEQELGPIHLDTTQALNNLAVLYGLQGRYEAAEPLLQRALSTREQTIGLTHPSTAASLNNLATLYRKQEHYEKAEPLYQRALAICEEKLGPSHPSTATSLNNLALVYRAQGKYSEAEPLYQRALAICEEKLGPSHPGTATSLNNLAMLYRDQGQIQEAEVLLRRALAIREQELGSSHPDTAQSLADLALLYHKQGKNAEAETLLLQALVITQQVLDAEHPLTKEITQSLIDVTKD